MEEFVLYWCLYIKYDFQGLNDLILNEITTFGELQRFGDLPAAWLECDVSDHPANPGVSLCMIQS